MSGPSTQQIPAAEDEAPVGPPAEVAAPTPRAGGTRAAVVRKPPPTTWQKVRRRLSLSSNRALVSFAVFLVIWHVAAIYIVDKPIFLTGPVDVARAIRDLWTSGTLTDDAWVSGKEFVKGFVGGLIVGIALGMALGTSRRFKGYVDPAIDAFYATPLIALAPLFILWFGIGETKTVVLVFMLVVLPIAINTDVGIRATDAHLLEAARSFGANRRQLFTMVRLPTSVSFIVAGIRMGIARGLIGVVVGEFFGSQQGLGYRILISSQYFDNATLLGGVLIFAMTGVVLVKGFERIERRIAPWKFKS